MASEYDHSSVVDVLLRLGADPNLADRVSIITVVYTLVLVSAHCEVSVCVCLLNKSFSSICAGFHLGDVHRICPPLESDLKLYIVGTCILMVEYKT